MDEKTLRALIDAGAIKQVKIIANGCLFHVEAETKTQLLTATTLKGKVKTWRSLDSSAKWIRALGIGKACIHIDNWQPNQKALDV